MFSKTRRARTGAGKISRLSVKCLAQSEAILSFGQQVTDVHSQRLRQAFDIVDGDISLATLHATDVGPMQLGAFGQRFLRHTFSYTKVSHLSSESLAGGRLRYSATHEAELLASDDYESTDFE